MENPSPADVATRWIDKWAVPGIPSGGTDGFDLDHDLPYHNPRICLDTIVQVLVRISSNPADRHFQVLAAGPLEDLLVYHGPEFLEEIDTLCRRSPPFRALLNGVWTSRIDQGVADRLAKYRGAQ